MNDSEDKAFFSKIESPYQAEAMIRDASKALYVVALLQAASAFFTVEYLALADCAINACCGYLIIKHDSRAAALFALVLAVTGIGLAINSRSLSSGGIIFGLLSIWAGARSFEAITKLKKGFPGPREDDV